MQAAGNEHQATGKPQTAKQPEETYDDCGVAFKSSASDLNQAAEYPKSVNEFIYGFYNILSQPLLDMTGMRSAINHVATEVEEEAEHLRGDAQMVLWETRALEAATNFFKDGFAYVAKRAADMADTDSANINANLYNAVAAVAEFAYAVAENEQEKEQVVEKEAEALEHSFEIIAEAAEFVREATAEHKPKTAKLSGY